MGFSSACVPGKTVKGAVLAARGGALTSRAPVPPTLGGVAMSPSTVVPPAVTTSVASAATTLSVVQGPLSCLPSMSLSRLCGHLRPS
jgi:hypothetical protein